MARTTLLVGSRSKETTQRPNHYYAIISEADYLQSLENRIISTTRVEYDKVNFSESLARAIRAYNYLAGNTKKSHQLRCTPSA